MKFSNILNTHAYQIVNKFQTKNFRSNIKQEFTSLVRKESENVCMKSKHKKLITFSNIVFVRHSWLMRAIYCWLASNIENLLDFPIIKKIRSLHLAPRRKIFRLIGKKFGSWGIFFLYWKKNNFCEKNMESKVFFTPPSVMCDYIKSNWVATPFIECHLNRKVAHARGWMSWSIKQK